MKIKTVCREIRRKIKGDFAIAKEKGMIVEEGVTVMGDVNFGAEPYLITLRRSCRISSGVQFVTHDGGTWAFRKRWPEYRDVIKYGRIEIGEETFIGARSIVMPGVKIGRNCVVGAGSIVTKSIPDESVAVGVPAKVICTTREYAEKCLGAMPEDFDRDAYESNKKDYLLRTLL